MAVTESITTSRRVPEYAALAQLEAGLAEIERAPTADGALEMIVARPRPGERTVPARATLDVERGLVGDSWHARRNPDPRAQITLMSVRVLALLAGARAHWPLAGDQLLVDFDLSAGNVPPGTRLAIGSAVIEITAEPHTGCRLFKERFGADALRFVSTPLGRQLQLRGVNGRVIQAGEVAIGDRVRKV